MYIKINDKKYEFIYANTFFKKLFGLMGKKHINYCLYFKNTRSIHTFFMKENIDVLLIDSSFKIINKKENLSKNKILIFKEKNTSIIEMPQNTSKSLNIGDILKLYK